MQEEKYTYRYTPKIKYFDFSFHRGTSFITQFASFQESECDYHLLHG